MIDRLPEDAQTLHAEMLALLLALAGERSWAHLSGSFTTKTVKDGEYLYFQYSDPGGRKRQLSIGRRDAALDRVVEGYAKEREDHEADLAQVARLANMMRAAGAAVLSHAPGRVIRALVDAGVFAAGGVLVGSYAFQMIGNLLGVRWPGAAWRTQDVDIAGPITVAVPNVEADVPKALDGLKMGFVPVPQLDGRQQSTSFRVRGKPLRLDLITPGRKGQAAPVFIPRFKAAAAPIKHLGFVLGDTQPAIAVNGASASLVIVPSPARFVLHKLLVSQMRSVAQQTKSRKDIHQAALCLEVLAQDRPTDLDEAARVLAESGPSVTTKARRALDEAERMLPTCKQGADQLRPHLRG